MEPTHEGDGIKGVAYEVNVTAFEYGFLKDVEWGETTLSISEAELDRRPGHGGGVIKRAMPGATVTKGKKANDGGGGGLRGSGGMFDRRLAQKTGVR